MSTIYLNIGTPRTGSTALQNFLTLNRNKLEQHKITYPNIHPGRIDHNYLAYYWGDPISVKQKPVNRDVKQDWKRIHSIAGQREKMILSAEVMGSALAHHEERIRDIQKMLFPHELKIVVYLARQDFHAESWYNQLVKANQIDGPIDIRKLPGMNYDYADYLGRLAQHVGKDNIIARPYELEQFEGGNLFKDFCAAIGLDWDNEFIVPENDVNPRLRRDCLEILRLSNAIEKYDINRYAWNKTIHAIGVMQTPLSPFGFQPLLSAEQRREILDTYEESNRTVAREYLGREDGILYLADKNGPVVEGGEYAGLKPERLVDTMMQIWELWEKYLTAVTFAEYNYRQLSHLDLLRKKGLPYSKASHLFHKICHSLGKRFVKGWPSTDVLIHRLMRTPVADLEEAIFGTSDH